MRFFRRVLDFILPTSCSFCNGPVGDSNIPFFCSTCWADFALIQGPVCPRCGRPFDSPETTHSQSRSCVPPVQAGASLVRSGIVGRIFRGSITRGRAPVQIPAMQDPGAAAGRMDGGKCPCGHGYRPHHAGAAPCEQAERAGFQSVAPSCAPDERNAPYPVLLGQPLPDKTYPAAGGAVRSGTDTECGRSFCASTAGKRGGQERCSRR